MKKEIYIHATFFVALFLLTSIVRHYFQITFIYFFIGGIIGTMLPDIDHFIYIYYLKPQELTSRRASDLISRRQIWRTLNLLALTRGERSHLIFHTLPFQLIFTVFTFFVVSSSGSLFGKGLVLAFYLHLVIDQAVDLWTLDHLNNWLYQVKFTLTKESETLLIVANICLILIFSILF